MDEQYAIDVLSGQRRGFISTALRAGCTVGSWGYAAAIAARNAGYDAGWLRSQTVAAPVISIGNLTTGGTGKTPVAALLATELKSRGFQPAIVSRGYRSLNGHQNDEQLVLSQLLPNVVQVQQQDRVSGATIAMAQGCDAIILDDGFQHRRLRRDLDIVLVDATRPWGFGRLLPRGLLREPLASLRRADLVLITRCDQATPAELAHIRQTLLSRRGSADAVEIAFAPRRLRNTRGEFQPLTLLKNQQPLAFCGIGNPAGFRGLLQSLGIDAMPVAFPDHHHYQEADFARLSQLGQQSGATCLVTTQKDLVKIPHAELAGRPVWAVEIAADISSGGDLLETALSQISRPQRQAA